MAREGWPPDQTCDGRIDREVLSSHRGAEEGPRRRRPSVVALLLTMLVTVGLAVWWDPHSHPSGTAGASSPATSYANPPASLSNASLVDWVRTACPRVRRLALGDVDTLLFVEIGPCPTASHRGQTTDGSPDVASTRSARVVRVHPVTGDRTHEWIEVRCPRVLASRTPVSGYRLTRHPLTQALRRHGEGPLTRPRR